MDSATILVIDDERHIRQFLRAAFEFEGFTVDEASDAEEGIRSATLRPPDLIVLDLGLPDQDGSTIIARLRSWSNVPIIVLTVRSHEREKVRLLELGADDYVVKPFGIGELIARVRASLRPRVVSSTGHPLVKVGRLEIDLATRSAMLNGKRPAGSCATCGQGGNAPTNHEGSLGFFPPQRHALLAHRGARPAQEDRSRSDPPTYPADRARRRISSGAIAPSQAARRSDLQKVYAPFTRRYSRPYGGTP